MQDLIGRTLGHYRVVEQIGAGGMGEVYRATDERLDRDVAIKVLPDEVARDPERLARFEREAKLLASLSHQNIATLHGLEEHEGQGFLVMELAEGTDLAHRIALRPIPIDEALDYACQIAEGLEAAHEKGIIHRDLKPANVMLSSEGGIKILDFGLAKALDPVGSDSSSPESIADSPTLTAAMTGAGVLLGTAAYMSPEQARGRQADKRADVWAFGCVLYETLTGRKVFDAADASGTMAAILRDEPDWTVLPAATPNRVRRLLARCLTKDPRDRFHDIADARITIQSPLDDDDPIDESSLSARSRNRWPPRLDWVLIAILAPLALFGIWSLTREQTRPAVIRTLMSVEPADWLGSDPGFGETFEPYRLGQTAMTFSPDGGTLVFSGGIGTNSRLYVRKMNDASAKPIPDTERGVGPFFSPDGEWVGFWAAGKLKKVRAEGGPTTVICSVPSKPNGSYWGPDGEIFIGRLFGSVLRVTGDGGSPEEATILAGGETGHRHPHLLPDGDTLLFTVFGQQAKNRGGSSIVAESLTTGERKILVEDGAHPRYSPTGHLLFSRMGVLMAAPFDARRLEITGGAVVVLESVRQAVNSGNDGTETFSAQFSLSATGTLAHVPGGIWPDVEFSMVWVDLEGREEPLAVAPRPYISVRLSPDGKKVVYATMAFKRQGIWIYEISRGTLTRITHESNRDMWPLWTPDGSRITYSSDESGQDNIHWIPIGGTGHAERLSDVEQALPASWTRDGEVLAYVHGTEAGDGDIWILEPGDEPRPFIESPFEDLWPAFSPDDRWLAYVSSESGKSEVYVTPYPGPGPRYQISNDTGRSPSWAPDGRQLYYLIPDHHKGTTSMWAVDISMEETLEAGKPRKLFTGEYQTYTPIRGYDISPDGRRFLMLKRNPRPHSPVTHFNMTFNWFDELERLVPTD